MRELTPTEFEQLDAYIFQKRILEGIQFLRDLLNVSLHDALNRFSERYTELRRARGDRFSVPESDYWKEFHS